MGDLTAKQASGITRIVGKDELFNADVLQGADGVDRLSVDASTAPRSVQGLFIEQFENMGSTDLNVNGSATPVQFEIPTVATDRVVTSISIFGRDAGIKFGQFLAINQALQNGLLIEIKSDDVLFSNANAPIIQTDDFRNKFCISPRDFVVDVFSNEDVFTAAFVPPAPIILRGNTQFATPDFIRITVRDNISAVNYLEASAFGGAL